MGQLALEVADIFRAHGDRWRQAQAGYLSLEQLKVMSAIEQCRTSALVYAKCPFAGPEAVLAYPSRYTHRVAISNRRLVNMDNSGVTFRWKDYRAKGRSRQKTMTLTADEFMRRFLLHILPAGFHRIRHYGLLANCDRRRQLAKVRDMLKVPPPEPDLDDTSVGAKPTFICRCCGMAMSVVEIVLRRQLIRAPP